MSKNYQLDLHTTQGGFRTSAEPLDEAGDRWAQWVRRRKLVRTLSTQPLDAEQEWIQPDPVDTVEDTLLDGEYTGGLHYVAGRIVSDQAGKLFVEVSENLLDWDPIKEVSYSEEGEPMVVEPLFICGRYVRFRYENGQQEQQFLRLVQILF